MSWTSASGGSSQTKACSVKQAFSFSLFCLDALRCRSNWYAAGVLETGFLCASAGVAGPFGPIFSLALVGVRSSFQNVLQEDSKVEPQMVKRVLLNHRVGGFAKDLAQSYRTGLQLLKNKFYLQPS